MVKYERGVEKDVREDLNAFQGEIGNENFFNNFRERFRKFLDKYRSTSTQNKYFNGI